MRTVAVGWRAARASAKGALRAKAPLMTKNSKPEQAKAPKRIAFVRGYGDFDSQAQAKPKAAKMIQTISPASMSAKVLRNVAMVPLSEMRRALEIAEPERTNTNSKGMKEASPATPLEMIVNRSEDTPA